MRVSVVLMGSLLLMVLQEPTEGTSNLSLWRAMSSPCVSAASQLSESVVPSALTCTSSANAAPGATAACFTPTSGRCQLFADGSGDDCLANAKCWMNSEYMCFTQP